MSEVTGSSYDQKFVCTSDIGQNIWSTVEKSSKTGQNHKALISTFAHFFRPVAGFSNSS